MTLLTHSDICDISSRLADYDRRLCSTTGHSLLGIAALGYDVDEIQLTRLIRAFSIHVVPLTVGQGIITDFSETVCSILKFIGFDAQVTAESDTAGLASAFEKGADAIIMADDIRFVGINLHTHIVADNSEATGRVFATALGLMAEGISDQPVLVMGCGPVGASAAKTLLQMGAQVALYDMRRSAAIDLQEKLSSERTHPRIEIVDNFAANSSKYAYILEATPSGETIPDELIGDHLSVSAPGVPLGVSKKGCKILKNRLVHDKLELGVAAMAVNLVLNEGN